MGGGGRTTVQAPQEGAEQRAYYAELARDIQYARDKKTQEEAAEATRKANLRTAGLQNLGQYSNLYQQQLKAGALTADRAKEELDKYQQKYRLEAGDISGQLAGIEQYQLEQLP